MEIDKEELEEEEIWKDIPNYELLYQASTLDRIRSKDRKVKGKGNKIRNLKGIVLNYCYNKGYKTVTLSKEGKVKTFTIHSLVAITFLGHKRDYFRTVVDHKNRIRDDNRLSNLRLITNRENTSNIRGTSKYTGVHKGRFNKWYSTIRIRGKKKFLESFDKEEDAANAYKNELKLLKDG